MNRNVPVPFLGEEQRQRWLLTRLRALVPSGVKAGTYLGRVAVRATGSFNITIKQGTVQGISHRSCTLLHKCDGYDYRQGPYPTLSTQRKEDLFPPQDSSQLQVVFDDRETIHYTAGTY